MTAQGKETRTGLKSFRTKLLLAMMLVVLALTSLGLYLAQRKVAIEAELDLRQDFRNELATLHGVQEVRHAALAERCRTLVLRPRIHAALEDNALDLLYPSAKDELRDIIGRADEETPATFAHPLSARFYRFLDGHGAVITPPPANASVGELRPTEEARLTLPTVPREQQIGYLLRDDARGPAVDEILAMPIVSTQTGEVIAALVLGFKPAEVGRNRPETEIKSGLWLGSRLHLPAMTEAGQRALSAELSHRLAQPKADANSFEVKIGDVPHLVFYKQLNPGSLFPPAYEVAVYPLANAIARQHEIRTHVILTGLSLLVAGLLASHLIARRLSRPVEKLAVTSEENRAQRQRAEAALEITSEELQRSARFSADASHQLKTPVTVLRAGIDELLSREHFAPDVYDKLSALLHQTYRITSVIDDLLLLSRMDAGRLQINFGTVDLSQLLEEWIDDLSALPDDLHVQLQTNFPPGLRIAGERSYVTLIVQNLLENARKYNIPGGTICVYAREEGDYVSLCVENTSRPIPLQAQAHIFERFHRGGRGENIPGHGLGLNLARELARLHGGDLRLVRSDEEWTEFEVRFRVAKMAAPVMTSSA
ncbi:MAG TPA: HAMP domain-containing sensor histidine kinase [Chthoniobacterales bacterium]|nr:HAMP domain-containing sensor histidine kinase [Chthoniobacterales bacterium]